MQATIHNFGIRVCLIFMNGMKINLLNRLVYDVIELEVCRGETLYCHKTIHILYRNYIILKSKLGFMYEMYVANALNTE